MDSGAYGAFRAGTLGDLAFGCALDRYDAVGEANPVEEALPVREWRSWAEAQGGRGGKGRASLLKRPEEPDAEAKDLAP